MLALYVNIRYVKKPKGYRGLSAARFVVPATAADGLAWADACHAVVRGIIEFALESGQITDSVAFKSDLTILLADLAQFEVQEEPT